MITDKRIVALRCEKEIRKDSEGEYTKEKTFVVGEAKLTPHPKGHRSRITRIGKQYDEDFKMGYFRVEYENEETEDLYVCLLYTSPSPRDRTRSRMPSSA